MEVATLPAGSRVRLAEAALRSLRFPPPSADLTVVVHAAALRAPYDRHTQVACVAGGDLVWLGALGEDLLETAAGPADEDARALCARHLLVGSRVWEVVNPGLLVVDGVARPLSTVYDGSDLRPWIIIGETVSGDPVAVPLNEPTNPKWWTPLIAQADMSFPGNNKNAQVELAHLWTFPSGIPAEGSVLQPGRVAVEAAIRGYFVLKPA
jgi:hypothetical protein